MRLSKRPSSILMVTPVLFVVFDLHVNEPSKHFPPSPKPLSRSTLFSKEPTSHLQSLVPSRREESLPESWCTYQLAGRDSSQGAGIHTPYSAQLVGRNSSRQAGTQSSLPGGIPPDKLVSKPAIFFKKKKTSVHPQKGTDIRGYPRGYPPAPAGIRQRMWMSNSAEMVSGYPHPNGYPDVPRPPLAVAIVMLVGPVNDYQKELQFKKLNAQKEDQSIKVI
ncbi:hypothetical protein PGTUg99_023817 [Puccinia graminis f. sp. tritici]|uniref:Uncharacterized protein n=1 Tax=Puccinia graminis f. sp. tritici TaxID=56615 RepID=A0A5B0NJ81_PUCGR|nr:hypothetical protein PGTUg99_023817 [Puccinia graminis f. sp. tritici]